jgi:hypothetical protein
VKEHLTGIHGERLLETVIRAASLLHQIMPPTLTLIMFNRSKRSQDQITHCLLGPVALVIRKG